VGMTLKAMEYNMYANTIDTKIITENNFSPHDFQFKVLNITARSQFMLKLTNA